MNTLLYPKSSAVQNYKFDNKKILRDACEAFLPGTSFKVSSAFMLKATTANNADGIGWARSGNVGIVVSALLRELGPDDDPQYAAINLNSMMMFVLVTDSDGATAYGWVYWFVMASCTKP